MDYFLSYGYLEVISQKGKKFSIFSISLRWPIPPLIFVLGPWNVHLEKGKSSQDHNHPISWTYFDYFPSFGPLVMITQNAKWDTTNILFLITKVLSSHYSLHYMEVHSKHSSNGPQIWLCSKSFLDVCLL